MYYLIDGYNLIFSLIDSKESLQNLRNKLIQTLKSEFRKHNLTGTLVFDGSHRKDEESGLSYPSPLVVAYSHKGQSADERIIELIEGSDNRKQIIVITNDKGLRLHANTHRATVWSNSEFIGWLKRKDQKELAREIEPKDSKENIDRLLKIFEERLKNDET